MAKKVQAESQEIKHLKEILEGVDAVGTIVEEDLGYLRQRLSELQEAFGKIRDDLSAIKLDQKMLENNQGEIMETLKMLSDKLDKLEVRVVEGGQKAERVNDLVDDEL